MKSPSELIPENFNDLLKWFSANRETAGEKYEEIRNGLIRYFYFKGCDDAENLADEAINRVASKLPVLDLSNNTKPINLFYGFASKIYLEQLKQLKTQTIEFNPDVHAPVVNEIQTLVTGNKKQECLEECLAKLSDEDRDLIVGYYSFEKAEKIEFRRKLAERLKLESNAIHVKIHRLRKSLRKCVEKCTAKK